jgi:hypothetical protein
MGRTVNRALGAARDMQPGEYIISPATRDEAAEVWLRCAQCGWVDRLSRTTHTIANDGKVAPEVECAMCSTREWLTLAEFSFDRSDA